MKTTKASDMKNFREGLTCPHARYRPLTWGNTQSCLMLEGLKSQSAALCSFTSHTHATGQHPAQNKPLTSFLLSLPLTHSHLSVFLCLPLSLARSLAIEPRTGPLSPSQVTTVISASVGLSDSHGGREGGRERQREQTRGGKERSCEDEDGEGGGRLAKDTTWPPEERGSGHKRCRAGQRGRGVNKKRERKWGRLTITAGRSPEPYNRQQFDGLCVCTHLSATTSCFTFTPSLFISLSLAVRIMEQELFRFHPFIKHMTAFIS